MSDKELITALQKQVAELLQRVSLLEARNADLALKNAELTEELVYYKAGRNSRNSHLPPGSDLYKQVSPKHKKKKSSRNVGGQHGHKASRLEKVDVPDVVALLFVTPRLHGALL